MNNKLIKALTAITLLLTLTLNIASCSLIQSMDGPKEQDEQPYQMAALDLMENIKANSVTADEKFAENNAAVIDFSLDLFKESLDENQNTLISPLSAIYALAMTANGADGETRAQMEELFGMSVEQLNLYLYSYADSLSSGNAKATLNVANSVWFRNDGRINVSPEFLQNNADYYGADIFAAPFDDTTLVDINFWVKNKTNGMIPEILNEIPSDAVMYLINALCFEAFWEVPYDEEYALKEGTFKAKDGSAQDAVFMYGSEDYYFEDEQALGFMKRYEDPRYAFAAILPNEGVSLDEYIATLDAQKLSHFLENKQWADVYTRIPKFSAEGETDLAKILKNMGMTDAFDSSKADFSYIADEDVYIGDAFQKTFIDVNEDGTKAGAATVIQAESESAPIKTVTITLDRPFIYILLDTKNNIPIMIGTLNTLE